MYDGEPILGKPILERDGQFSDALFGEALAVEGPLEEIEGSTAGGEESVCQPLHYRATVPGPLLVVTVGE